MIRVTQPASAGGHNEFRPYLVNKSFASGRSLERIAAEAFSARLRDAEQISYDLHDVRNHPFCESAVIATRHYDLAQGGAKLHCGRTTSP